MTSGREPRPVRGDLDALLRENASLRAENRALLELCHEKTRALRASSRDRARLDEILGSRAWAMVQRARRVATRVLPESSRTVRPDGPAFGLPAPSWATADATRISPRVGTTSPKVSVIVPNYNHATYLEERLRSIFAQTYPPHEILFLDDASTDESLAIARRLEAESPVPFRIVESVTNSGSTFRQWLRGIDLAGGDLIWIAESDDTCRPELLETLVPAFDDPEVALAYCQSARIDADGILHAPDYLDATDDISPVRWRTSYCVPGHEEIERALCQRNTIPNASAVVFRKPAEIAERDDLESLRIGGDWLFYAMRLRRGKIAYVPEPLNGHRHHDRSVRIGFERAVELFAEQLRVKARIFESFPVSAGAICSSLARGFAEYADRLQGTVDLPPMTEHPALVAHLDRIGAAFDARLVTDGGPRLLIVVSGLRNRPADRALIRRAVAMARRFPVFLANAAPGDLDPVAALAIDEPIIPIEGPPGIRSWSWDDDLDPRRAAVIRELVRFHQIDAVHTDGDAAEELVRLAGFDPAVRRIDDFRTLVPRRQRRRPSPVPASRPSREVVLAARVHRLTLALRDTRKRLTEVERVAADHAAQSASFAWRLGAKIDRVMQRIAPTGSRRRRALGILRRKRRVRPAVVEPARPESPIVRVSRVATSGRVLIMDHDLPTPDLDAGSLRMFEIIRAIRRRGRAVVFIPDIVTAPSRYADELEAIGVEMAAPGEAVRYLEEYGETIDLALLSRATVGFKYLAAVRRLAPRAVTMFDTVDLHYVREWRAARVAEDRERIWEARRRRLQELDLVRRSDVTLVVSDVEKAMLERQCPGSDVRVLPTIVDVPDDEPPGRDGRRDLVFIGGFRHAPNVDAVEFFVAAVLPRILERVPDLVFHVVGSHPPEHFAGLAGENVKILGYVPDLTRILCQALISVAPLRYGAGVKGKVNMSMAHGVPTVISTLAAEGMHLVDRRDTLIADDPADFAAAVVELIESADLWECLSRNGRGSVRAHFSVEAVAGRIDDLLALIPSHRREEGASR